MKKLISDIDLRKKSVLLRVDFNVPLEGGKIADTKRIDAALETIKYLLERNCKIVLVSHLGRPQGFDDSFSLKPVYQYLKSIFGEIVFFASDVVGDDAKQKYSNLKNGQILLLENVRFEKGEEEGDEVLAKKLANFGEIFVNDAFATAHRKHASTYVVAKHLPCVAGFLMGAEVNGINSIIQNPARPFVVVCGGAKVKDKIKMLSHLATACDVMLVGGAMAQTFLKAQGANVGKSKIDEEGINHAKDILQYFSQNPTKKLILPIDFVCENSNGIILEKDHLENGDVAFDIGSKTAQIFSNEIMNAKTVLMNGPVGMFENDHFANGTKTVAKSLEKTNAKTLVGGGDSARAIKMFCDAKQITHLSTGGGASLKMMEGGVLPCVSVLQEKED